jgi:hypothetical protein
MTPVQIDTIPAGIPDSSMTIGRLAAVLACTISVACGSGSSTPGPPTTLDRHAGRGCDINARRLDLALPQLTGNAFNQLGDEASLGFEGSSSRIREPDAPQLLDSPPTACCTAKLPAVFDSMPAPVNQG